MKHIYVSMFGPLPAQPTGLAMSVLRRAQAFANTGISTDILIDKFYPDYDLHMTSLVANGSLGESIRIRSIFFELADQVQNDSEIEYRSPLGVEDWVYTQDKVRPEVWRGRFKGEYLHFVWTREEGRVVHFIDNLVSEKRTSREWFDSSGRVCKREIMTSNNRPVRIEYVDQLGRTYLVETLDEHTQVSIDWKLFDSTGMVQEFASFEALYHYWLITHVFNEDETPTVISEYGFHRESMQRVERTHQATVVYTFHSNHLGGNHSYGNVVRPEQADFVENLNSYAASVVLTNEQRLDLWKTYGYNPNIFVIPHHLPIVQTTGLRNPKKIVMIGRFDKDKGQEDAIRAFEIVIKSVPDATLDFYGRGADEDRIEKMIADLGLGKSVSIKGFTDDSFQIFTDSAISLVPSKYEGFCLSLAESMASGCVPISYDFKYGPRALIKNGVDGLIVEKDNIEDLADAMILLLSEDAYRESLSTEARKIRDSLSEKSLINSWIDVLQKACERPKPASLTRLVTQLDPEQAMKFSRDLVSALQMSGSLDMNGVSVLLSDTVARD